MKQSLFRKMNIPFEKIKKIQIITTQLASDLLAGAYHSAFKGKGIEFEEVREYQTGDDIRSIDWNVTARMSHPYIKIFKEERELTVMLVVDISASTLLKKEMIAEIAAVLAFSAIKNNDKIGLLLFSDQIELYLPPKKGTRHVLRVIRELLAFKPKHKGTNFSTALTFLGNVHRKRSICFLISDFIGDIPSYSFTLASQHHDFIAVSVTDPLEINLPDLGITNIIDLETGKMKVVNLNTNATTLHKKRLEDFKELLGKTNAGYIAIKTDEPYMDPLRKFFKLREIKR